MDNGYLLTTLLNNGKQTKNLRRLLDCQTYFVLLVSSSNFYESYPSAGLTNLKDEQRKKLVNRLIPDIRNR